MASTESNGFHWNECTEGPLKIRKNTGKVMFCFWDIEFFIFWNIQPTFKILTSWWVLTHELKYIFEYIFAITNQLVMKIGQLVDLVMGNIFRKYFAWFGELGSKSRPFLIYHNQKPINMSLRFLNFLQLCNEAIKNRKHDLLKINRLIALQLLLFNQNHEKAWN